MYRQQIAKKTSLSSQNTPINRQTLPTPSYGSLSGTIQRAAASPETLREDEWLQLDKAIGTRATNEIKSGKRNSYVPEFKGISAQFSGNSGQVDTPIQKKDDVGVSEIQPENKTGLPDNLKAGVENLSGYSLDDVKVHYNSPKPSQLQAHAYTQGTDIHVSSGQEKHLPHETWHVVQQMQGRVKPTMQMMGKKIMVNEEARLEREADKMGAKAIEEKGKEANLSRKESNAPLNWQALVRKGEKEPIQRVPEDKTEEIRRNLPESNSSIINKKEDLVQTIATQVQKIKELEGVLHFTGNNVDIWYEAYAKDYTNRYPGEVYTKENAKEALKAAQARGFTTLEDETWYKGKEEDNAKSDIIHEMVHILSARGGATKLGEVFGNDLNEGMTQYFTEEVCKQMDVVVNPAYKEETEIVRTLAQRHGDAILYQAYFQQDVEKLVDMMLTKYKEKIQLAKDAKKGLTFTERQFKENDDNSIRDHFLENMKKHMTATSKKQWIKDRI